MRLSGTKTGSANQYNGLGDQLYDLGGARPTLDLNFASNGSLVDSVTGKTLVTHTRASNATYVDGDGIIQTAGNNVPRFDHNPTTGESLGLLVEESRTNLITYSQTLNNAAWLLFGTDATITATTDIAAPDGSMTAWTLTCGSGGFSQIQQVHIGTSGVAYTGSFWIRRRSGTNPVSIRVSENINTTLVGVTSSWQRFNFTATSTSTTIRLGIHLLGTTDAVDIWGAQLEAGSFPTSYIRTTGSTVTRSADVTSIEGNDFGTFNFVQYSEEFDNASWIGTSVTWTASAVTAPNGTLTVLKPSTTWNFWAFYDQTNTAWIAGYPQAFPFTVTNQWARQSVQVTAPAGCTTLRFYPGRVGGAGDYFYQAVTVIPGNTYTASAYYKLDTDGTVLIWGAQLEQSSTATPYVKSDVTWTSRASNATYYDYTGTLRKSSYNLLTYSEDITNADWSIFGTATRSANTTTAPDGTTTADSITLPAGSGIYDFKSLTANTTYTFSAYIKGTPGTSLRILINPNVSSFVYKTVNVTDNWVRYDVTHTTGASDAGASFQFDTGGGGTFYVWGMQAEAGPYAGDYAKTEGSAASSARNVAFLPDGSGNFVSAGELLLEDAGTNFIPTSEPATGSNLAGTTSSLVSDITTPDGQVSTVRQVTLNSIYRFGSTSAGTAGTTYTGSIWIRTVSGTGTVTLDVNDDSTVSCDLTETWQRFEATGTHASNNYRFFDVTGSNLSIYVWGAQLETGSYATSYIPTSGSTATRAADVSSSSSNTFGNSFYKQTEGTVFANCNVLGDNGTNQFIYSISDGVLGDEIRLFKTSGNDSISSALEDSVGGTTSNIFGNTNTLFGTPFKTAHAFAANYAVRAINGINSSVDNTVTVPAVNQVMIGARMNETFDANIHLSRLTYWPTRLSNDTLQGITQQ